MTTHPYQAAGARCRPLALALVVLAAALGAVGLADGPRTIETARSAPSPSETTRTEVADYLVVAAPGSADRLAEAAAAHGARVDRELPLIDAVVVTASPREAADLRADGAVASVHPNRAMQLTGSSGDKPAKADGAPRRVARSAGVTKFRKETGADGGGVDVAIVDSGVARVPGLDDPARIVRAVDLTPEADDPARALDDGFGHGTHLAGLVAGGDAGWNELGMAPGARLVSIKVATEDGSTDLATVIHGIQWAVRNSADAGYDVRVLLLAIGIDDAPAYVDDPLALAVQRAWDEGITVVVAAGNEGHDGGAVTSPATNPYVIAVGASDHHGTGTASDDDVSPFSSTGVGGTRQPDLYAPGTSVLGAAAPGSAVVRDNPGAVIGGTILVGSGTSQAAAVVAGAVADLLQSRPGLTNDQVKALLVDNAANGPGDARLLRLVRTEKRKVGDVTQDHPRPDPSLLEPDRPDLLGNRWAGNRWAGNRWAGNRWAGNRWATAGWDDGSGR